MLGFWFQVMMFLFYVCHFMSCHWHIYLHFKKYEIIINIPLERGTHVVLDSGDIFLWFSFHHFGSVNLFKRHLVFPQSLDNNSLFFLESYINHSRAHLGANLLAMVKQ